MTFKALADFVEGTGTLPVPVDTILEWIRNNTDHNLIKLHGVTREHKGFRGAFRRRAISKLTGVYNDDYDIFVDILYGLDLDDDWKRLVIVKEALHVFDGGNYCVNNAEKLQSLIPFIIDPSVANAMPAPVTNDHWGQFRAMAIMMPARMRNALWESVTSNQRTVAEVAEFVQLPEARVDLWLRLGPKLDDLID